MPFFIRNHQPERTFRMQIFNLSALKLGPLICGLTLHRRAEVITGNAVRKSRKVLDLFDADQVAAGNVGFEHKSRQTVSRSKQASGEAGEAGAHYDDVVVRHDELNSGFKKLKSFKSIPLLHPPPRRGGGKSGGYLHSSIETVFW